MSRGTEGRAVAWQVWSHYHFDESFGRPIAYEHQCGSLGKLPEKQSDYDGIVCPGCRFELARPESECTPLYGPPPDVGHVIVTAGNPGGWLGPSGLDPVAHRDLVRATDLRTGLALALTAAEDALMTAMDQADPDTRLDADDPEARLIRKLSVLRETVKGTIERDERMSG